MTEWIIEADKDSVFYMFKQYAPLVRCKDCEHHGTRTNMCDIWHRNTNGDGYCHRAKAKSKEQKAKSKGGEEG